MCCKPQPSLIRLGTRCFLIPVRFGVWYMRISTLCSPNSATSGAINDAHDGLGASRVPRSISVRTYSFTEGFVRNASRTVNI